MPTAIAARLDAHLTSHTLDRGGLPGRVVPAANWHVTLHFLGELDEAAAAQIRTALAAADLGNAFEARLGRLGAFPRPDRARVLWIGFVTGQDALTELARRVTDAMDIGLVGTPGAGGSRSPGQGATERPRGAHRDKPFSAHLTLSRLREPAAVAGLLAAVPPLHDALPVTEVVLFRSVLGKGPPTYERLSSYPLR